MIVNSKQAQMFVPWERKGRNRNMSWTNKTDPYAPQLSFKKGHQSKPE